MSEYSQHVNVTVTADSVAVARPTFKRAAVVSHNAAFAEPFRIYNNPAQVLVDFVASSPEARSAAAFFGQTPRGREYMVLKAGGTKPTQRYTLDVEAVRNSHTYQLRVEGQGVTPGIVQYVSDVSTTDAEIVAGLVSALNTVTGRNFTAAGASSPFTITGNAPGDWFSIEVLDVTALSSRQNHADPGIADALAALSLLDSSWYWISTLYNSEAYVAAVAAWCQANRKLYAAGSSDTRDLELSTGSAGTLDVLKAAGYKYAAPDYHPRPAVMADAALVGTLAAREIGSWTAKFKRRAGIPPVALTPTQRANLVARHANFYEPIGSSLRSTSNGTTSAGPSVIGGFIDDVVNLDYFESEMQISLIEVLAGAGKIDRDDEGVVPLESAGRAVMDRMVERRIAKAEPAPTFEIPPIADQDDLLPRGVRATASMVMRGAVHDIDVTASVTL